MIGGCDERCSDATRLRDGHPASTGNLGRSGANRGRRHFSKVLQAYGGVIAVVIAVGYGWPLECGDRFIVSQEKATEAKLGDIRESALRARPAWYVDIGRLQSSIANRTCATLATRSTFNQILLLIYTKLRRRLHQLPRQAVSRRTVDDRHHLRKSLYRIEDSPGTSEYVKHPRTLEAALMEANRQSLGPYMFPSPIQDAAKGRSLYKAILQKASRSQRF